jgi:nicotinamidase-related amidase
MSTDTALLVIDVQVGLIEPSYRGTEVLEHINTLLDQAHNSYSPVIYIQHDEPEGYELEVGTAAWEIHPAIAPKEGDVIIHKRASDSFHKTTLLQELERQRIDYHNEVLDGFRTDDSKIAVKKTNEVDF